MTDCITAKNNGKVMLNDPVRNSEDFLSENFSNISMNDTYGFQRNEEITSLGNTKDRAPLRHIKLFKALSGFSPEHSSTSRDFNSHNARTLTTFSGVFAPVCLSMFSAILFLRVGYILGNSGLLYSFVQIALAYLILFFTVLSICAISTNGAIEGGGAYFMISRALGPEFGGSIGTLFFFANIFSSALYLTGCVEGLLTSVGPTGIISKTLKAGAWWSFIYASSLNTFNMLVCLVGAALFAKTSIIIFGIVMFSAASVLISLITHGEITDFPIPGNNHLISHNDTITFTGFSMETFKDNIYAHYGIDYTTNTMSNFAIVFGVLFSGITGIMAGANMSGELKDAGKSIPKGTVGAVCFTLFTYTIIFLLTAATCPSKLLRNNYLYMQYVNYVNEFVTIGLFSATFFAALSNLIGSSRILEALAKDNLFGIILEPIVKLNRNSNPFLAVLISWCLIECVLLIGSLNAIAQITSVFFLLSYFSTNLACLALTLTSAPNFRPSFRYFSWYTTMIAMFGCLIMMFVIDPLYAAVAVTMCLLLVIMLHLRSPPVRWGSISQALIFHQVRKYLLLLDSRKDHVKYWRPQFLLMIANPRSSIPLITFVNDLKKSGLYVLGHIKIGDLNEYAIDPIVEEYPYWLELVDKLKVKAFVEVTMCSSIREGLHHLARLTGLGAMKPNTVLLGFYDDTAPIDFFEKDTIYEGINKALVNGNSFLPIREHNDKKILTKSEYVMMIHDSVNRLQKNVVLARHFHSFEKSALSNSKELYYIDIWPINFFSPHDSVTKIDNCWLFMMQLACILHMVPNWKKASVVRVFMCVDERLKDAKLLRAQWEKMLQMLRIEATIDLVSWDYITSNESHHLYRPPEHEGEDEKFIPSKTYLMDVNSMIRFHSEKTALVLLYLPLPDDFILLNMEQYLERLDLLTEHLPPTLLVHGISPVTSTTL